jgi:type IV pilus assembly protein PilV
MSYRPQPRVDRAASSQAGFMLLEVLCALLIFAVGVLALVGLQTASIQQAAAAEYRSTAQLAANDLVSRMWISDRTAATLQANFATGASTGYAAWWSAWQPSLPGTSVTVLAPTVQFTTVSGGGSTPVSSSLVTITMNWQAPSDSAAHKYTLKAELK